MVTAEASQRPGCGHVQHVVHHASHDIRWVPVIDLRSGIQSRRDHATRGYLAVGLAMVSMTGGPPSLRRSRLIVIFTALVTVTGIRPQGQDGHSQLRRRRAYSRWLSVTVAC